jgi:hypothetical protein
MSAGILLSNNSDWWRKLSVPRFWTEPDQDPDPPQPGDTATYRRYTYGWSSNFVLHTSRIESVVANLGKNRYGIFEYEIVSTDGDRARVGRWHGHDEGFFLWKHPTWIGLNWDGGYFGDE